MGLASLPYRTQVAIANACEPIVSRVLYRPTGRSGLLSKIRVSPKTVEMEFDLITGKEVPKH